MWVTQFVMRRGFSIPGRSKKSPWEIQALPKTGIVFNMQNFLFVCLALIDKHKKDLRRGHENLTYSSMFIDARCLQTLG